MPEALDRGLLLVALWASACAHNPTANVPPFDVFAASLPRDSASVMPFQPERLRGQVVMVTFVSSWCFPCLTEVVTLERLQTEYGAQGFQNVLVGMDLDGHRVLDPFAESYAMKWPLVVANDQLRAGETPFGHIRELPMRVIFGRDGRYIDGYTGVVSSVELEKVLIRALEAPRLP